MKPRYRWFYSTNFINQKMPTICVCLIEDDEGIGGIGVSICSESDNPFSKRGRGQAFARAHHAFDSDIPSMPVLRKEALKVIALTAIPLVPAYKCVPSGNRYYDHMRSKFWSSRAAEIERREQYEESKKEKGTPSSS